MTQRIAVLVMGNPNAGKSTTWNKLFRRTVRTGKDPRKLFLSKYKSVQVFLINGSPEERELDVSLILPKKLPRIVLCSIQYRKDVTQTIDFFLKHDYYMYVQWLNPGYHDRRALNDSLRLIPYLLRKGVTVAIRNGKHDLYGRVQDLREIIYGWAWNNRFIRADARGES